MSPTPRTDESRRTDNGETGPLLDKMEVLETELAAAKGECERLKFATEGHLLKTIQQQAELAAAKAECNRLYESSPTALDALTAELTRLRAELVVEKNWVEHHSQHADDLIGENVQLRAEVERLDAEKPWLKEANARAAHAEAALAEWSVLNLWGGTPEIIHEFIKGQQNRIHHCQDLGAECLEQARLLGMSGEREADLLGKLERLAKDKARLDWLESPAGFDWQWNSPHSVIVRRAAIDAAMKP